MDINAIAGTALLMKTAQTQQTMSTSMIKQAADQQNQLANLLAQNVRTNQQPQSVSDYIFSTYA